MMQSEMHCQCLVELENEYDRNFSIFDVPKEEMEDIYNPHMRTISLCVMCLPILMQMFLPYSLYAY
jgi:hypothetical protein